MIDLSTLLEKLEDADGDQEAVEALQNHAHSVFQEIFDRGHGEATQRAESRIESLETELEEARQTITKKDQRIERLEEEQPDVAEIESQYQDEIEELKEQHRQDLEEVRGKLSGEREARARSDLVSTLVSEGVDRDWAEVQVHKALDNGRIRHTEDGEVEVMQRGKEIPMQLPEDRAPVTVLAEEIKEETPPKFLSSSADRGSGAEGGSGGAGGGSDNVYDRIREQATEERGKRRDPSEELDERLGATAPR